MSCIPCSMRENDQKKTEALRGWNRKCFPKSLYKDGGVPLPASNGKSICESGNRELLNPKKTVSETALKDIQISKMAEIYAFLRLNIFFYKFNNLHYLENQFHVKMILKKNHDVKHSYSFLKKKNCWSLAALQCFVSFCCTAKSISYACTHIPSLLGFLQKQVLPWHDLETSEITESCVLVLTYLGEPVSAHRVQDSFHISDWVS